MGSKKMKPVKAWMLVYRDGANACGYDTGVFQPYLRRADARVVLGNRREQYGDLFRIAHVEIREVQP
jgi:hypothetical protein